MASIGMITPRTIKLYTTHRTAGGDIQPHAYRSLMEVGLAIRNSSRKTNHRHDRVATKHNHPYVGNPLIRILGKCLVKLDQALNHRHIRRATQRVEAGQDIRDMPVQVFQSQARATGLEKLITLDTFDDQNSLAAAAFGWLDDKAAMSRNEVLQPLDFYLCRTSTDQGRRGNTVSLGKQLGFKLVIDQRVES